VSPSNLKFNPRRTTSRRRSRPDICSSDSFAACVFNCRRHLFAVLRNHFERGLPPNFFYVTSGSSHKAATVLLCLSRRANGNGLILPLMSERRIEVRALPSATMFAARATAPNATACSAKLDLPERAGWHGNQISTNP